MTAAFEDRLGFSLPVVDYALDRLFGALTAPALRAAIEAEIGDLTALDGPATGVDRVTIVVDDTEIGTVIAPLAFALCAKARVTVRDRGEALVAAFAETLGEALPALRDAIEVRTWSEDAHAEAAADRADVVVTFEPRAAAIYLDRAALDGDLGALTAAIARDARLSGATGMLTLCRIFVAHADAAAVGRFERALADAYEAAAIEFPAGARDVVPLASASPTLIVVDGVAGAAAHLADATLRVHAVAVAPGADDRLTLELVERLPAERIAACGDLCTPPLGDRPGACIMPFVRGIERA